MALLYRADAAARDSGGCASRCDRRRRCGSRCRCPGARMHRQHRRVRGRPRGRALSRARARHERLGLSGKLLFVNVTKTATAAATAGKKSRPYDGEARVVVTTTRVDQIPFHEVCRASDRPTGGPVRGVLGATRTVLWPGGLALLLYLHSPCRLANPPCDEVQTTRERRADRCALLNEPLPAAKLDGPGGGDHAACTAPLALSLAAAAASFCGESHAWAACISRPASSCKLPRSELPRHPFHCCALPAPSIAFLPHRRAPPTQSARRARVVDIIARDDHLAQYSTYPHRYYGRRVHRRGREAGVGAPKRHKRLRTSRPGPGCCCCATRRWTSEKPGRQRQARRRSFHHSARELDTNGFFDRCQCRKRGVARARRTPPRKPRVGLAAGSAIPRFFACVLQYKSRGAMPACLSSHCPCCRLVGLCPAASLPVCHRPSAPPTRIQYTYSSTILIYSKQSISMRGGVTVCGTLCRNIIPYNHTYNHHHHHPALHDKPCTPVRIGSSPASDCPRTHTHTHRHHVALSIFSLSCG